MKKTVIICLAVLLIAVLSASLICLATDPPESASEFVSPNTGDLNLLIIVPVMLIAAFIIFIIIKRNRDMRD